MGSLLGFISKFNKKKEEDSKKKNILVLGLFGCGKRTLMTKLDIGGVRMNYADIGMEYSHQIEKDDYQIVSWGKQVFKI